MTVAVKIKNLCKTFVLHNQGGVELPVLRNVNLEVAAGECVALDGASGAGKSTLLKCIYANYLASSGSIIVNNGKEEVDITVANARALIAMRQNTVGYVSQFLRAIPRIPAVDIVVTPLVESLAKKQTYADARATEDARRAAEQLLLRLRIPMRLWTVPPATFSGGEQQRVNIARSFIRPMPVLLLDEPTASLDAQNRVTVTSMINEAREAGAAIIGIFHDQRIRDVVATRVVQMTELAA